MGRTATDKGGADFAPAPAGTHIARCIELIDIGTHHDTYEGKETIREQVIVRWELPHELIERDGKSEPMIVSKFYTNSLGDKANMRKDLEGWRGRAFTPEERAGFDLMNLLGKPCQVTIQHTPAGKAKVIAVTGMTKGTVCPPQVNPSKSFWIEEWDGNIHDGPFAALPKGFQALIMASDEYKALIDASHAQGKQAQSPAPKTQDFDDDIPF